ncbi:hypothetical protein [Nocardia altamirensis]|uniref:hypothetical protein n=1 Tax=Nocardia altamirensis TaxID=472158 RepID=UPI0008406E3A|nr:hypothetical protein [Nocardia altamirensis]
MTRHRHRPTVRTLLLAGACAGLLAACSDTESKDPAPATPGDSTISLTMPSTKAQMPDPDAVSPAAGKQLCDMMNADLGQWRVQGAIPARVAFNGTVHNWAARNGGLNDTVLTDRAIIDTITEQNCPDVRKQALEVLDADNLASTLLGG